LLGKVVHNARLDAELDSLDCPARLRELEPSLLGSSSGHYHALRGQWARVEDAITSYGFAGVEHTTDDLEALAVWLAAHQSPLRLSVHAPSDLNTSDIALLTALPAAVDTIVVHAEHFRRHLELLAPLGSRVAIENLDSDERYGSSVSDLEEIFTRLPEARFCLDVAHADWRDPSQELAHALLDRFSDRLAQVHLSVLAPSCWHLPLTETALRRLEPVLARVRHVPWVLESPFADGPCDKHACALCGRERL
jgi:hypothetical protein